MEKIKVDRGIFTYKYLPEFAAYILRNKLDEFVTVGIRFCREVDLPLLKPLARYSEKELVAMSLESNQLLLDGLVKNTIADFIELNLNNWIDNKIGSLDKQGKGIVDSTEIVAEDITLAYHLRRKLFFHFLYGYNQNAVIQQMIINEIDTYTSYEELLSLKVYLELDRRGRKN